MLNGQTQCTKETPLFFAVNSKCHKKVAHQDRIALIKYLIQQKDIDLGAKNKLNNTCYEAHADSYGYDEVTDIVEKAHQKQMQLKMGHEPKINTTNLFLQEVKVADPKNTEEVENFVFSNILESKAQECRNILVQSQQLQDKLKILHTQKVDFDKAYTYIDTKLLQ